MLSPYSSLCPEGFIMSTETTTATPSKTEALKNRLKRVKRHIPAIAGFTAALVATVVADHYRREVLKLETFDENEWPAVEIPPVTLLDMQDGATLKARMFTSDDDRRHLQYTTLGDFSDEANEAYDKGTPGITL